MIQKCSFWLKYFDDFWNVFEWEESSTIFFNIIFGFLKDIGVIAEKGIKLLELIFHQRTWKLIDLFSQMPSAVYIML